MEQNYKTQKTIKKQGTVIRSKENMIILNKEKPTKYFFYTKRKTKEKTNNNFRKRTRKYFNKNL